MISKAGATAALMLTAALVITSCSGSGSPRSSSLASSHTGTTPQSSGSSQVSARPTSFTSAAYGYTLTLPAHWTSRQAFEKWDIQSELDATSPLIDLFGRSSSAGAFAAAAGWKRSLAAFATYLIAWNAHYHEHCPQRPNTRNPVTIGGQPGVLLAYNCGILINIAASVHSGVGYQFTFFDYAVAAATDPTDHATFLKILRSVQFPD